MGRRYYNYYIYTVKLNFKKDEFPRLMYLESKADYANCFIVLSRSD